MRAMSLATRCTACGTIFRVVQDQLKVSEGWVRCGRCDAVFNALEGLFDLERDDPPAFTGAATAPGPAEGPPDASAPVDAPTPAEGALSAASVAGTGTEPAGTDPERTVLRDPYGSLVHEPTLPMSLDELPSPPGPPPPPSSSGMGAGAETAYATYPSPAAARMTAPPPLPAWAAGSGMAGAGEGSRIAPDWVVARHDESVRPGTRFDPSTQDDSAFEDARFPADAIPDEPADNPSGWNPSALAETEPQAATPAAPAPEPQAAPEFVRQADRRAFWTRGPVRAVMAVLALLLLVTGAGQVAHQWRDEIAARWPPLREPLELACAQLGCSVEAPREIDQIVVESTALTRTNLPDAYRLTVVLRNRAAHALAQPSIDLSLTDVSGAVVSRRALAPADFARPAGGLPPRVESTYDLVFAVGNRRVTGYTVAVFYP